MRNSTYGVIAASSQEATPRDPAAFVAMVESVLPAAYRLAVGMLRSDTEAEDVVQEAMFRAWRHFGRFRQGAEMKPWLLTIVANECRRQRRSRWFWVVKTGDTLDRAELESPDSGAEGADLRRALYRLPHDQRLVLVLRYYLDLSFEEVGKILRISTKAARSRTYRALEKLRLSPEVIGDA